METYLGLRLWHYSEHQSGLFDPLTRTDTFTKDTGVIK
jgi:hypothetical protein